MRETMVMLTKAVSQEAPAPVDVAAPRRRVTLAEVRAHKDALGEIGRKYG